MLNKLRDFLWGKKVYFLMAIGALVAVFQYFTQIDLTIPGLPMATDLPKLLTEIYAFALGASTRAALAKSPDA